MINLNILIWRFVVLIVFSPFSTWVPSWLGWNLKSFHHFVCLFVCLVLSFFQIYNSNYYWALCPKKKRPLICQWLGPGFSILFMATFIRSDISNFVGYRGDQGDCHFYESASPFYDPPVLSRQNIPALEMKETSFSNSEAKTSKNECHQTSKP